MYPLGCMRVSIEASLNTNSVPFFVLNGHYGVSGAQPPEVLLQVIEQARLAAGSVQNLPEEALCSPDGC